MKRITPTRSLLNKYDNGGPSTPPVKVEANYCTIPARKSSSIIEPWASKAESEVNDELDVYIKMYHETLNKLRDIRGFLYKNGIDPESLKR